MVSLVSILTLVHESTQIGSTGFGALLEKMIGSVAMKGGC